MENQPVYVVLLTVSTIFSVVPVLFATAFMRTLRKQLSAIVLLVTISLVVEIANSMMARSNHSNVVIFYGYTVVEFALISWFYSKFIPSALLLAMLVLVGGVLVIDYARHGVLLMNNLSMSVECIVLACYALYVFYYFMQRTDYENLLSLPVFWINSAVLVYFLGNLLLFLFNNYFAATAPVSYVILWSVIHTFFNVFFNGLISVAFWKARTT